MKPVQPSLDFPGFARWTGGIRLSSELGVWGTGTIALSPDGKRLVCGADGHLGTYVFDTRTGRPVAALDEASGGVQFSQDGRWVLLSSDDGCRLFRTDDWQPVWKLPNDPRAPSYAGVAAFSPDGNQLAYAASTRGARLVETATGRTLAVLEAPAGSPLNGLRWTANGRRLVGDWGKMFGSLFPEGRQEFRTTMTRAV